MKQGIIFDMKEFSVHDGPGVRQTVFLKGCPLRCAWCHTPESWQLQPQLLVRNNLCTHCGRCKEVCRRTDCIACGECSMICPVHARNVCGEELSSPQLVQRILKSAEDYAFMGGGVTFSGGEPLLQAAFLFETAEQLPGVHKVLETCGYAPGDVFRRAMELFDLIYMDFKLADPEAHLRHTGKDNKLILENISQLCAGDTPFVIRIPLIPGITDTEQNLTEIAQHLPGARKLQFVELLPYNTMAGAKYQWLQTAYAPEFDEHQKPDPHHEIFQHYGIESRCR